MRSARKKSTEIWWRDGRGNKPQIAQISQMAEAGELGVTATR
jgi:hypothetical protein